MAQTRQRRREVARAKWERQQARREVAARRARRWRIVGAVVVAVVGVALLTWLVVNIVQAESGNDQAPVKPLPTGITPSLVTPSGRSTPPPTATTPTHPSPSHQTHATQGNE